jgi:uncharacterized protein YlxW (UPF0749 family)
MRAVIWTVVGVIVVAAVVVFVHLRSQEAKDKVAAMPSAAEIRRDVDGFNKKADEYAAEMRKLRQTLGTQLTDEKKAKLAQADSIIAQIRTNAGKLATLKGDELLNAKRGLKSMQQKVYDVLRRDVEKK